MHQISPVFAVPFVFDQLAEAEPLNRELRALFLARETEGARYANPNPYTARNRELFESNFDLFDWPETCVQQLREFCLSTLLRVVGELNAYDAGKLKRMRIATDAWFHITRRNGFFAVHNHPMASWSGVYCVSPGRQDTDQPDSGKLSFINPYSSMYSDAGNAHIKFPYQAGNYAFQLAPGQLILFPSWVLHQVMPFFGEDERITVAFNCAFQMT